MKREYYYLRIGEVQQNTTQGTKGSEIVWSKFFMEKRLRFQTFCQNNPVKQQLVRNYPNKTIVQHFGKCAQFWIILNGPHIHQITKLSRSIRTFVCMSQVKRQYQGNFTISIAAKQNQKELTHRASLTVGMSRWIPFTMTSLRNMDLTLVIMSLIFLFFLQYGQ